MILSNLAIEIVKICRRIALLNTSNGRCYVKHCWDGWIWFGKELFPFSRCYSANVYDYTSLFGLALANHYLGDYQAEESILDELVKHKRVSPAFYNRAIVKMHRRAPKEAVIADLRTSLRLDREFAKRARKDAVFSPLLEDRCFKCLTDLF